MAPTKKPDKMEADLERLLKMEEEVKFWIRFSKTIGILLGYIVAPIAAIVSFISTTKDFWKTILREILK